MVIHPNHDLLLIITVRSATLETLKQTGRHYDRSDHTHPGDAEAHGDRAHQPCQEETDR